MRFRLAHELPGRVRFEIGRGAAGGGAGFFQRTLGALPGVRSVEVCAATGTVLVRHAASEPVRGAIWLALAALATPGPDEAPPAAAAPDPVRASRNGLAASAAWLVVSGAFPILPRLGIALARWLPFVRGAARELRGGRLGSEALDAVAIGTALAMGDVRTAGVISLLLRLGDHLKLRTDQRTRRDLAEVVSRDRRQVWVQRDGMEVGVEHRDLRVGDRVVVRAGSVVPADGLACEGEALLDQASLTGESLPVARGRGALVYEGTAVVEGALVIEALKVGDETRLARILRLVEEAEGAKAKVESRAARLADRLVPWVLGAAALTGASTGDLRRMASVLLVDYSCALKLAVPLAIRTCLSDALGRGVLIRGGRYVEALAGVDTLVFDKTGTLTQARPRVREVIPLDGIDVPELLVRAACIEEHFPHPFGAAIQDEARRLGLSHEVELHGDVRYVVANGVATDVDGRRVVVGSRAFLRRSGLRVEAADETVGGREGHSLVYIGIADRVVGVFVIDDPVRDEAAGALGALRALGIERLVLLTGDGEANARRVAGLGFDRFHAEVSPEQKAEIVAGLEREGRRVAMVGDGVNDAPALSAATVGISFQHGAELARESADVVMMRPDLTSLPWAIRLARQAMGRVRSSFRLIAGVNSGLMAAGALGALQPALSGALHNATTVVASMRSLRRYREGKAPERQVGRGPPA